MILTGLGLAQLAAVFGALGLCVVALYLLKLRRRTVAVPFAPLWERVLKDKEASSLFAKLKRVASMLLQLLVLALLVLALGNPRVRESLMPGRTLVVLLDASASMQATDVPPNRLAVAKEEARRMARGLGGADKMLIAQMASVVTPMGPMTGDAAALEREIEAVRATDEPADFSGAMRFAGDVLRDVSGGEIVVVSDGALGSGVDPSDAVHLGDANAKLRYVSVGRSDRNVAITQFSVRRYPLEKSRYEVMIELANTGSAQENVELQLLGDGTLVDLVRLTLRPGERVPRFYPQLSGASRTLEATVAGLDGAHDELAVDDHVYALLPERRRLKVLVVTSGNTYLDAALLLDEYLDVTEAAPNRYDTVVHDAQWDAIVFDRFTPDGPVPANALYLDPSGSGSPVSVGRELKAPTFDKIERTHPAVRFIALDDVNVSTGHALVPSVGDHVLGAADGGASPILVSGTRDHFKFIAVGFDVRDSDWPLRPAWPLFVVDCLGWFAGDDAQLLSSLRTGEEWHIPVSRDSGEATVTLPDGSKEPVAVRGGVAVVRGEHVGFYSLSLNEGDREASAPVRFAANLLDARESAIAPAAKLTVDGRTAEGAPAVRLGVRREIWVYLLLAAALLVALECATYPRRITV